jgi:uncharacterized protein YfaQ (DUF2300 family)
MSVRLDAQNGVQLLRVVANIDTVLGVHSLRDPKQSMKPHHVIDPEKSSILQVVLDHRDGITVAILSNRLRLKGWDTPILSSSEKGVWGGAYGDLCGKQVTLSPHVVAMRMNA